MKKQPYNKSHSHYKRAVAHAENVLKLPVEEIMEKLKTKSNWGEDRLPTIDELAILILIWADEEDARRGIT